MASALTEERVRRDVDVVARAGLDIDTFLAEAVDSLQRAVPHVAACLATVDPSTELLTGTRKYGDLLGRDAHDHEWGLIEYGSIERTAFSEMSQAGIAAAGVHAVYEGDTERSNRLTHVHASRTSATATRCGSSSATRARRCGAAPRCSATRSRGPSQQGEIDFVGSLSAAFAAGMRTGLLARMATVSRHRPRPPGRPCSSWGPTTRSSRPAWARSSG